MEAFIEINCSTYSDNIIDVLKAFNEIGWGIYNDEKKIEYLPVEDVDTYDWHTEKMSEIEFYDIIRKKIFDKELIGVNLFYGNSNIGISFLAHDTAQIILGLAINRKLFDKRHTDVIWYIEHIICNFMRAGIRIKAYKVEEFED